MAELRQSEPATVAAEAANPSPVARRRAGAAADAVLRYALPVIVVLAFLAAWQFLPRLLGFRSIEVPNFTDTMGDLRDYWSEIGSALLITLQDAVAGFLIGNLLAILGATAFVWFRTLERAFYPIAIIVQTIPIIVYVPLLVILFDRVPWFNANSNAAAVVGVTVLICIGDLSTALIGGSLFGFPVMVSVCLVYGFSAGQSCGATHGEY